ncbi:MAG: MFS transporter [Planctomycetes bacterium]|nr:MFS transporter [Planctomycetota bacterium]
MNLVGLTAGRLFHTQQSLTPADRRRAAGALMVDGVCSSAMVTLQGGPFLAAFAIALGASNYEVGLLATIGFASQLMQLLGLLLVQRMPVRRAIIVLTAGASRLLWVLILLIPVLFADRGTTFLMQWLFVAAALGAMGVPAWNSLIRDVVPARIMGRLFSRRLVLWMISALVLTGAGGYFVDGWTLWLPDHALYAYSILFAAGLAFGLVGLAAIARLPEPRLEPARASLADLLKGPVADRRFRNLLHYIAFWNFAVNMAGPFFIVYLLQRIGLALGTVTMLVVISQITNTLFLRIWGKLADRYSNRSVLAISSPLFLLAIVGWTFTTLPEKHLLTMPLLVAIHVLSGMSLAGVSLASWNIAIKLSPPGQTHAYMAVYGIAGAVGGAVAPMLGGVFADFFATRELAVRINWIDGGQTYGVEALSFKALDFLFLLAFVLGVFSLRFLRRVHEDGHVEEKVVREDLLNETFALFRVVSTIPGLRYLIAGPLSAVSHLLQPRADKAEPPQEDPRQYNA